MGIIRTNLPSWMMFKALSVTCGCTFLFASRPGPLVIKLFSCSAQLSMKFKLLINIEIVENSTSKLNHRTNGPVNTIHVIPPSSSGRLQEMSHKVGKNSLKKNHFLTKIQNLPEMNQEFSYIFYTFFKKPP